MSPGNKNVSLKISTNISESERFTQLIKYAATQMPTFSDTEHDDHYEQLIID